MSIARRGPIVLEAAERRELERRAAARTAAQQAAYRAQIILRAADGQTDQRIAAELRLAERTVWEWRRRFARGRLAGLQDRPKCPRPRRYDAAAQAPLPGRACQTPAEVDPTRAGQTHWTIQDL